jgi:hypothetical protein
LNIKDSNAVHYADNAVLGAKNFAIYPYKNTTKTLNGVVYTDNGDGSITLNTETSASADGQFELKSNAYADSPLNYSGKTYVLSGFPTGQSYTEAQVSLRLILTDSNKQNRINVYLSSADAENGLTFTIPATHYVNNFVLYVGNGTSISNLTVKPMIRLASDTDNTFTSYAMTNKELTDKVQGIINATTNAADFAAFKSAIANI